jgi:LysM repeat protein
MEKKGGFLPIVLLALLSYNENGFPFFFNKEVETMAAKRFLQITLVVAVLAASLAIPGSASAGSPCGSTYIIQQGDWLSRIANRCGVTLSALYAANPGVAYQRYIYPGQVLNIPGSSGYVAPYGNNYPPPVYTTPSQFYYPSLVANPHVGGNYYSSSSFVGDQLTYQVTVWNNGNVALQIVANFNPPHDWDVDAAYDNCGVVLGAGKKCTLTYLITPQDNGYDYLRVYVRGLYTDSSGDAQRVTASPAFLFVVN